MKTCRLRDAELQKTLRRLIPDFDEQLHRIGEDNVYPASITSGDGRLAFTVCRDAVAVDGEGAYKEGWTLWRKGMQNMPAQMRFELFVPVHYDGLNYHNERVLHCGCACTEYEEVWEMTEVFGRDSRIIADKDGLKYSRFSGRPVMLRFREWE